MRKTLSPVSAALLFLCGWGLQPVAAQIQFDDETTDAGIDYVGESYGASVGYANDDVLPDIFLSRHRSNSALLINLADGSFEDREFEVDAWQATPHSDTHGGTWADFDNDGDMDLTVTAGSKNFSQFLVNSGSFLSDEVANYSFDTKAWGGRLPVWFDFTNDGVLDVAFALQGQRFQLFEQTGGDFAKRNFAAGNQCDNNDYGLLSDITLDGTTEWICASQEFMPQYVYDYSTGTPFVDRTPSFNQAQKIIDSVAADFDGDLIPEIFGVWGRARVSGAEIVSANSIEAHLIVSTGDEKVITFQASGAVEFEVHWSAKNINNVHIGASGANPPFSGASEPIRFTLSPADTAVHGMPAYTPGGDDGIFVGYDPVSQTWTFAHSSGTKSNSYVYAYVNGNQMSNLNVIGLGALDMAHEPVLLKFDNNSGTYTDAIAGTGLDNPLLCVSVVAADFDNDMDMDLYLACRDTVSNAANLLYRNDGSGNFSLVPNAGGAAGPVGSGQGLSETVVVTDYDVDGFVDLLVTNGLKLYPENEYNAGGPEKLYRNRGNGNHWLELDLAGTASNADGIGAIVTVTAGGVSQRKEQNGGYHRWSQNDTRLHFGLAGNTTADVTVRWPSGQVDNYVGVSADRLHTITEGAPTTSIETIPTSTAPSVCVQTAGQPLYDPATDIELFIWKDACGSNTWKVRATGGDGSAAPFEGKVVSDLPITNLTPVGLEAGDSVVAGAGNVEVSYTLVVNSGGEDGFDFTVADGAATCFGVGANSSTAIAGALNTPLGLSFDLQTLGACTQNVPEISVENAAALEGGASGMLVVTLSMETPSANLVSVDYMTSDGTASQPSDYQFSSGTAQFQPSETQTTIEIPIVNDNDLEFEESFTLTLSNPVNATLANTSVTATINDDEPDACGMPNYDKASENAVFVWQDCGSGEWFMRVAAGGVQSVFTGSLEADENFTSVTPFGIEANDVLDFSSDPTRITYSLVVNNAGQDGMQFEVSNTASVCMDLTAPDVPIHVGASKNVLTPPFDLQSRGSCFQQKADLVTVVSLASGNPVPDEGDAVTFSIKVTNNGPVAVTGASLVNTLPSGLTYDSHAASKGSFAPGSGNWNIGSLGKSGSATLTITATVKAGESGKVLANLATAATAAQFDPTTAGDQLSASITVSSPLLPLTSWANASGGVAANGNEISYSGTPTGWSKNSINSINLAALGFIDNYEVRFTIESNPANTLWIVGLGESESSSANTDVDYGLRSSNGLLNVRENGTWLTNGPTLAVGDVISIFVNAGLIEYRHNGTAIYTSSYSGTPNFYVDSSFKSGAIALTVLVAGEADPVDPPTVVAIDSWFGASGGVSAAADALSYSGAPTGWNKNSINSASLASFGAGIEYAVSWEVDSNPNNTDWIVGLGEVESSAGRQDVDYGIQYSNGILTARQNGNWVANAGAVANGDVLSIRVSGASLEFQLNGVAFATRTLSGAESFYVDTSFKAGAINLDNFRLELP